MRFGQWFSRDSQDVAFVLLLQAQLSVLHVLGFFFCLFVFIFYVFGESPRAGLLAPTHQGSVG